jgi:DcuC family C4-dicarboxylate transporter
MHPFAAVFALADSAAPWQLALGLCVVAGTAWAVARRLEVRLALLGAALVLGLLAGKPQTILGTFLATFADEKFVVPICTALGFAYVLRHAGCDQHLVHLLLRPLRRARALLVPGTVVVGYLVNLPIVSQASTVVTLGPVIIPILRSAGVSPLTTGAALLLGSSIGGELLNPGAPEMQSIVEKVVANGGDPKVYTQQHCVERILPLSVAGLLSATLLFWALSLRLDRVETPAPTAEEGKPFQVNLGKALVPLLPLVLLYVTGPPLELLKVPENWLVQAEEGAGRYQSRLVGAAMLLGAACAALTAPRTITAAAAAFCEGAGYGFRHIISLIVVANCFGRGIREIGLAGVVGEFIRSYPGWLIPAAGVLPLSFALLCGSGMATTQSLYGFFAEPAVVAGVDPTHVGAVVAITAAAGRTMSPVAAVTLIVAGLTSTTPLDLVRRVALPLLAAAVTVIALAMMLAPPL